MKNSHITILDLPLNLDSLPGQLEGGLDPNASVLAEGITLLAYVISRGREDLVRLLIDRGVNLQAFDSDKRTPLQIAIETKQYEIAELFLREGVDPCAVLEGVPPGGVVGTRNPPLPLHSAAKDGKKALVQSLLRHGALVDGLSDGESALMAACGSGYAEVAEVLLENGADPNLRSPSGFTPLLWAAFFGQGSTFKLLIEHGADPGAVTDDGRNATELATFYLDPIFAQPLREQGIADSYSVDETLDDDWRPEQDAYDYFLSYKHLDHLEDVDRVRKALLERGDTVFVDRFDLALVEPRCDETIKLRLREAVNRSKVLVFFEVVTGDPRGGFTWQYFELLHAAEAVLVDLNGGQCSRFSIKPGERLSQKLLFRFSDVENLLDQLEDFSSA